MRDLTIDGTWRRSSRCRARRGGEGREGIDSLLVSEYRKFGRLTRTRRRRDLSSSHFHSGWVAMGI